MAMAEHEGRIEKLIDLHHGNEDDKVLTVKTYITGIPRNVNVDAYIPAMNQGGKFVPAFARISSSGAMWPNILEKAWAKLFHQ